MLKPAALPWLVALLALTLLIGQRALALIALLLLLVIGAAAVWRRLALYRVEYRRDLSAGYVFPGDEVTLTMQIANRKLLPLARVDVHDAIAPGLEVVGEQPTLFGPAGLPALARSVNLGWYEAVSWHYRLRCPQRGLYRVGPVHLRSGDPFGLLTDERTSADSVRLAVYPRLLGPDELGIDLRQLLGDARSRQNLIVDPVRTVGARDYHRDDPLKSIHWNATARRGELQTRVYEPTTSLELVCFLDVDTFEQVWEGVRHDLAERLISTAATVCKTLIDAGHSVGLVANGALPEREFLALLAPGRSPQQLARLMETLALLKPYSLAPMKHLLRRPPLSLSPGATVLLVSAVGAVETQGALLRLSQSGHRVLWVYLGAEPPLVKGVRVYHTPVERALREA